MAHLDDFNALHERRQRDLSRTRTMGGVGAVAAAVAAFMVWILNIDGRGEGLPGLLAVLMWLTTMLTTAWLIASAERRMADQLDRVEAMRYRDGYVDGYLDAATRRRARVEDG